MPQCNRCDRRYADRSVCVRAVLAGAVVLLLVACGGEPPEARLRRTIEDARVAAMAQRHQDLGRLVSERYSDSEGRDRAEVLALARGYLSHLDPVYLFFQERSLRVKAPGRAEVTLLVAVASVPVESLADLERITADLGRVELGFEEEDGDFKLVRARWSPASLTDWL